MELWIPAVIISSFFWSLGFYFIKISDIKKIEKACLFPCPITGAQISKYMDGAAVGIKIKEAQRAWIESNFKSDEAKILSAIGIKTSTHS